MVKTRNSTAGTQATVAGTCFVCNTNETTDGSMCRHCISRLRAICANKDGETDTVLARAIQIGKATKRSQWVKKAVTRLCSSCIPLKQTKQSLKKSNRALRDEIRKLKLAEERKKRHGFKVKSDDHQCPASSNSNRERRA